MLKNLMIIFVLFMILGISTFAQQTFRVGDQVEAQRGSQWVRGRVESIEGNRMKVRFGSGKYDFQIYPYPTISVRAPGTAEREANADKLRWEFRAEALDKYYGTVGQFAPFYDSNFISGGLPNNPAEWQQAMSNLAALDKLCKSKYPNITNSGSYLREGIADYRYAVWCEIAAGRVELEKKARIAAAKNQVTLTQTEDNLKFAFNHQKNRVPDETQLLMYDRTKWKAAQTEKFKPRFVEFGIEMPDDFFAVVEQKADELKRLIEQTAPNRSWEQPPFRDAVVENFIKGKIAADADYKGVQILKIGLDYKTWVARRGLSYVGSDSNFRYYKVEYNYYKRGWALIKLPNRPFCQATEWIVGRGAKGLVVVSLGGSGIFMKCS